MSCIEEYRVSVRVVGLKKRCRKANKYSFHLGYEPLTVNVETLKAKALNAAQSEMKRIDKAELCLTLVELKDGGKIETWSPFDPRTRQLSKTIKLEVAS